jgi:protein-tyrosine phosphatase
MTEFQRRLILEGAVNLRDLGGYRTADQRQTRWQVLLRSDNLDILTEADQQALLDYGIRHVVDLRSLTEIQFKPDVFAKSPHVSYHHLPLIEHGPEMEESDALPSHREQYAYYVDRCQPAIRLILETICAANEGAVVFHCAIGKDRTGVIAALLLALAAVDDEIIAEDYALTKGFIAPRLALLRQRILDAGESVERLDRAFAADPESMHYLLTHLHTQYGGAAGYVRAIGVDDSDVETLRLRFIGDV